MLEYLGRNDRRIKVHGQLVDLADVEHELKALNAVRDAAVSAVPRDDGSHDVVAHVVLRDDRTVTVGDLRRALGSRMPPYAIPRAFFRMKAMPRTLNDKIDRVRLRESAVGALPLDSPFVAARDETERAVARLFAQVLGIERLGVYDDFFELGGDSLSVVELVAALGEELALELSANELLEDATVAAVAARLADGGRRNGSALVRVNHGTGRPLFCVPGAGGAPVQLRPLGRRLARTAVHAFAYEGMDRRAFPDRSIPAIARRNIAALRAVSDGHPWRLLGFSFGGAVALEMAQQMQAAGDTIEMLVLLEPALTVVGESLIERSRRHTAEANATARRDHPGTDLRATAHRATALARDAARYVQARARYETAGIVRRHGVAQHDAFLGFHQWLSRSYRPSPWAGRTIVIGARNYFETFEPALDVVLGPASEAGRRQDVEVVNAQHSDLVREPAVAEVAYHLVPLLDQTWQAEQ
jgi:thioesterase domain-containing protein/acyl carrier protein